ncbi:MAG: polyphenol oxidase family protein [Acidimicrobiia bacterium]|nr:polyphenol oxidase family protein [Acidimicrobiia bacterium]MDH3471732.1 polyphenol oxidase family protein [Acidimicrobiia bacterium]
MIRPQGLKGAAFGAASDGDARIESNSRVRISRQLGISAEWATISQIHGSVAVEARNPGPQGEADALLTSVVDLPLAIGSADCVPVVLEGDNGVAVVHAGWRGIVAGVITEARAAAVATGVALERAAIGPAIGPCCYEVGPEVVEQLPQFEAESEGGAPSIDLFAAARHQLEGLQIWESEFCTMSDRRYHSHRRDATPDRQVTVAWLPLA